MSVMVHQLTRRDASELSKDEANLIGRQRRLIGHLENMDFTRTFTAAYGGGLQWTHREGGVVVTFDSLDYVPMLRVHIEVVDQGDGYGGFSNELAGEVWDTYFIRSVEHALGRRGQRTQLRPPNAETYERLSQVMFPAVQIGDILPLDGAWYEVWDRKRDLIELRAWTDEDQAITGDRFRQLDVRTAPLAYIAWRLPRPNNTPGYKIHLLIREELLEGDVIRHENTWQHVQFNYEDAGVGLRAWGPENATTEAGTDLWTIPATEGQHLVWRSALLADEA